MDLKSISWVFIKQIIILGLQTILMITVFFVLFAVGMNSGIILPANYADRTLLENKELIVNSEPFNASLLPKYTSYALLDLEDNIVETNFTDKDKEIYEKRLLGTYSSKYRLVRTIDRKDGKCVILYDMTCKFNNPMMNKLIPNVELYLIVLPVIIFVLLIFLRARKVRRIVNKGLEPLLKDIDDINNKDIMNYSDEFDNESGASSTSKLSNITEIANVQRAFDEMKVALTESLKTEWKNEQRRKENMAALAHDIKTPLTVIKGNAELLLEDAQDICARNNDIENITEDINELSDGILRNSKRIEGYIKLLMDESNKVLLEEIKAENFVDKIINETNEICYASKMPVLVENNNNIQDNLLNIDVERTSRAILNIVRNAIEHTDTDKGIILRVCNDNEYVTFSVSDYGLGFSKEAIEHGKELFFTENKARSGEHYGLGLCFADQVASECSGKLDIMNTKNGATVIFYIRYRK